MSEGLTQISWGFKVAAVHRKTSKLLNDANLQMNRNPKRYTLKYTYMLGILLL